MVGSRYDHRLSQESHISDFLPNNVLKTQEESVKGSRESHHPRVLHWHGYKALNTRFVQSWCFRTTPFYHKPLHTKVG
jgi:hypothetical protein